MRYLGTFVGFVWSVVHPIILAAVYWLVFSTIFHSGRVAYSNQTVPYICYFLAGFAPWIMFNDALLASTASVVNNPNYVKKIIFPTELYPIICFISSLVSQIAIFTVLIVIMFFSGLSLKINILELLFYFSLLSLFTLGISWATCALNVLFRDTAQVLLVIINIWFWVTPIVWVFTAIPKNVQHYFKLNPFLFFTEGYRRALFHGGSIGTPTVLDWFYYCSVIIIVLFVGYYIFKKLKPQFGDVI